jgi:uncharacterized protein (DUF2345 family)
MMKFLTCLFSGLNEGCRLFLRFSLVFSLSIISILAVACSSPVSSTGLIGEKLMAANMVSADQFGASVSISGNTVVVGARAKNSSTGAAYVFVSNGDTWSQQAELTASDGAPGDAFGISVSVSGDIAVVGAYTKNSSAGAAYVFVRSGTTWSQQAELAPADLASGDEFGASVGVSGDTVVVSSAGSNNFSGAAYVFVQSGTTWTQQAKLTAQDASETGFFGFPVCINGNTIAVGSPGKNSYTGAAYVFTLSGSTWTQQAEIKASDAEPSDSFGSSISLSGDTILVGSVQSNSYTGAAYVFVRANDSWTQQAEFDASDSVEGDEFGSSIGTNGEMAAVGACNKNSGKGAVYVFWDSGGKWILQTEFTISDVAAGDGFGISICASGNAAVIGEQSKSMGGAYVYSNLLTPPTSTNAVAAVS